MPLKAPQENVEEIQKATTSPAAVKEIHLCCSISSFVRTGRHLYIERATKFAVLLTGFGKSVHHGASRVAMGLRNVFGITPSSKRRKFFPNGYLDILNKYDRFGKHSIPCTRLP